MNRKPIFDAVRRMLGRGFEQSEVEALDLACDLAEARVGQPDPAPAAAEVSAAKAAHRLGSLSEEYESGGRGPGTVSGGHNDAGGVSYGVYQLASKTGTCAAFVKAEGKPWAGKFGVDKPGSPAFSAAWKVIAQAEPDMFRDAQHAFIERTHYRPVIKTVHDRKGLDLDGRSHAVRDAAWSCAVQHGGAATILIDAVDRTDAQAHRSDAGYDRKLVEAIYDRRIDYVLGVAKNPKLPAGTRQQLVSITKNRYAKERAKALEMLDKLKQVVGDAVVAVVEAVTPGAGTDTIDGNAVAAAHGVAVKSKAVKIGKLHPTMAPAIVAVAAAAGELGLPTPVITSGNDSKHMKGSLHFKDRALDFRGNNVKVSVGKQFEKAVAARLGRDYDVVFETFMNPANNHLHVEYDPK